MKRTASLFALVALGALTQSALGQPKPPALTPQQQAQQQKQIQALQQARQLAVKNAQAQQAQQQQQQAQQAAAGAGGAPVINPPFGAAAGTAGKGGAGGTAGTAGGAGTAGTGGAKAVVAIPAGTAELAALQATRGDRKKASAAALISRWGDLVKDDKAKAELKLHAQRVAYLNRIKEIAQHNGAVGIANSVDQLLFEEEKRDFDAMTALKGGAK